jgi:hypothetical protein
MAATDKFQGTAHVDVFVVIFLHLCKQVRKTTMNSGEYEVLSQDLCTKVCDFDFSVFFVSIWSCSRFRKIYWLPVYAYYVRYSISF